MPTTEDEVNTPLDLVKDLALDSTIPAPIRKNVFKAFDRLCSALIGVPVGALERRDAENGRKKKRVSKLGKKLPHKLFNK